MAEEDESQNAIIQDENMATERTDKLDKCLTAIKEDLASWLSRLLHIDVAVETFLQSVDTGVALGRLANLIQTAGEEFLLNNPGQDFLLPKIGVTYREKGAFRGSFIARDNVANLIHWCRELGVPEVLMFETEDLVTHKNEKSVLLALLEVARKAYRFGVEPPELVRIENEIDREIEQEPEETEVEEVQRVVEYHLKKKQKSHSLDDLVYKVLDQCTCPVKFPVLRLSEGKYRVGENKNLIFVRVMRNHVMVRVGGGWDTLERYFDKHDPCRSTSDRMKAGRQRRGSNKPSRNSFCESITRSPSSMSTCSMSSGDSGSSSIISHSRMVPAQETSSHLSNQTPKGNKVSRRNPSPSPRLRQTPQHQTNLTSSPKPQRRENSTTRLTSRGIQTSPRGTGTRKSQSMHDLRSISAPLERVEITCYRPITSRNGKVNPSRDVSDKSPKSAPGTPLRTRKMNANAAAASAKVDSRRSSISRTAKAPGAENRQRPSSANVSRSSSFNSRTRTEPVGVRPQRSRTVLEPTTRIESKREPQFIQRSRSSLGPYHTPRTTEKRISRSASTSPQRRLSKSNVRSPQQTNTTRRPQTAGARTNSPRKSVCSPSQTKVSATTAAKSQKTSAKTSPTRKVSTGSGRSKPASQQNVLSTEKVKSNEREKKLSRKDSRNGKKSASNKKNNRDTEDFIRENKNNLNASSAVDGVVLKENSNLPQEQNDLHETKSSTPKTGYKFDVNHNIEYSDNETITLEKFNSHNESPDIVASLNERSTSCSPNIPHYDVYSESGSELTETELSLSELRSPQPSLESSYSDASFALSPGPSNKLLESKRSVASPTAAEDEDENEDEKNVLPLSLKERLRNLNVQGSEVSLAARERIFDQLRTKESENSVEKQEISGKEEILEGFTSNESKESPNYGFLYQGPSLGGVADTKTCDAEKSPWSFVKALVSSIETTYKPTESQASPRKSRIAKANAELASTADKAYNEKEMKNNNTVEENACSETVENEDLEGDETYTAEVSDRELPNDRKEEAPKPLEDNKEAAPRPDDITNHLLQHEASGKQPGKYLSNHNSFDNDNQEYLAELSDSSGVSDHHRNKRNSRDLSDYFPKPQRDLSIEDLIQDATPTKHSAHENSNPNSPTKSRYEALI